MREKTVARERERGGVAHHEPVALLVVELSLVLAVLNLQLQPGVLVAVHLLADRLHDLVFPRDPRLPPLDVLDYPVIVCGGQ